MNTLLITNGAINQKIIESYSEISNTLFILTRDRYKDYFENKKTHLKKENVVIKYVTSFFDYNKGLRGFEDIDVIIANDPIAGYYGYKAKKLYNKRFIFFMCQDFLDYFDVGKFNKLIKPFMRRLLKYFIIKACKNAEVVALSNYIQERAIKIYKAKNVSIIPVYGVNTKRFKPKKTNLRKRLGLKKEKIIFAPSRVSAEKGLDYLIKAILLIKKEFSDIKLLLTGSCGDEWVENYLRELVKKLNLEENVKFIGQITHDKMPDYYNLCDVFVSPSLKEGLGFSSGEAMACLKPVVATNTGGIPDIVIDNKTGLLVNPADEKELAEKIILVLKDKKLATKLAKEGREHIKKNYEERLVFDKYIKFLKND